MRIAQLVETLGMGGAENLAVRIANALAERGHASHLFVVEGPGPLSDSIHPGVSTSYFAFTRSSVRNPAAFAMSLVKGRRILGRAVADQRIEVVQTHLPGANFWGLLAETTGAARVVATVHNNEEFRYGVVDNRILLGLRKAAYRRILEKCSGVVVVSGSVRDSLVATLGVSRQTAERITVVTNGVDIPAELAPTERRDIRKRFGIDEDQLLVLAAGRLSKQKNFRDLVAACRYLGDAGRGVQVIIAGEGAERPALESAVARHDLGDLVQLPGVIPDLARVMGAADVFAMTSLWEGLPLVLLEAMAAGVPVVAYDIPGVSEVVEPERTGLTVPVGEPMVLAAAIMTLLRDPDRRKDMGRQARRRVAEAFAFDTVLASLERLYAEIVSRTPGRPS